LVEIEYLLCLFAIDDNEPLRWHLGISTQCARSTNPHGCANVAEIAFAPRSTRFIARLVGILSIRSHGIISDSRMSSVQSRELPWSWERSLGWRGQYERLCRWRARLRQAPDDVEMLFDLVLLHVVLPPA
jgi:hypothetical protein